ncbi:MAG TPA: NAD-dependent epimerase/dehydratase family protein [Gaiellaceae bacterium]|nr:NAD-dependent epimerase/dehydratase family protein [Gaiellaceae bacterium]
MPQIEDSTVAVIGGAGFIGSHIVDQLLDEPVERVIVVDNFVRGTRGNLEHAVKDPRVDVREGSILDQPFLEQVMEESDYAFHLAALWLHECVHHPRDAVNVNALGTYNVIEAAQRAQIGKVVYSSSASVYGDALAIPMTEDHPFNNRTLYGATKIAGEQFFRAFNEQHGLDYVGLRYMNVYGPRMDYKGTYVSVIMKVLDKIEAGEAPQIFGDGSQAYDFVHVDDVARANILALKSEATDVFLNVGMGVQTTINELVERLIALTRSDVQPEYLPQEQMFVTNRIGSTQLAEQLTGFRATIGLDEGLGSVIEWRQRDQLGSVPVP